MVGAERIETMTRKFDYPIDVGDLTAGLAPGTDLDPGLLGYLAIRPVEGDPNQSIEIWAKISPEADQETFTEWADQRVERFMEHGAAVDNWHQQSDGKFVVWARLHYFPSVD